MNNGKPLDTEELKNRAIRFFDKYRQDLEQIRQLLSIRLTQLALAYTMENNLPPEAVAILTRVKPLKSFLKKLEQKGWPLFYCPTEIVQDLIGARVICWFIDDCERICQLITSSKHLRIQGERKDYIKKPKLSGYRSIHLLAHVGYDSVQRKNEKIVITDETMVCEIQVRTKLQDAWDDITHEFHYKAKGAGIDDKVYEKKLSEIAERLANEDYSLLTLRNAYQELANKGRGKNR